MRRSAIAVLALVSAACGDPIIGPSDGFSDRHTVHVSGPVVTETREVRDFSGISLSGVGLLVAERGSTETLTITANEDVLPHLISEVRGGVLHLRLENGVNVRGDLHLEYRVTMRHLDELRVSGAAVAEFYDIDTRSLLVEVSGASSVVAEGRADRQELVISGASSYVARDLPTSRTHVLGSGASSAVVNVADRLEGSLSGASRVVYIGTPSVSVSTSGGSSVRPQD